MAISSSPRAATSSEIKKPTVEVELLVDVGELAAGWIERHVYLKIERIERHSPARPQEEVVPPVQYGRDCLRIDV